MAQASTYFPKVRRMLLFLSPLILGCFQPASTLLHGHIALPTPSLPETDPQILEHWVTLMRITWKNHSKRWILFSNVSVTYDGFVNLTDRIGFRMLELFRKIDEDLGALFFGDAHSFST